MLEVCSAPLASPTAQVLEEDVGRAIEEDEEAFDELGRRSLDIPCSEGSDVPGLRIGQSASCFLVEAGTA